MQPTAKALELSESVARILEQSQSIILTKNGFNPSTTERTFRIGFSCDELLILPELSSTLSNLGNGLRIVARRALADQVGRDLDSDTIDLAIGCFAPSPSRYRRLELFRQELVCCYKTDLVQAPMPLDLRSYLSLPHAVVSLQHDLEGCFVGLLSNAGYHVNATVSVSNYLTALTTVASAPLIVTLPRQIAERHASVFGLAFCAAPVALELPPVSMIWSAQSDNDPSIDWLRQQIATIAKIETTNIADFKRPSKPRAA
jgi:DNA-binding transcriptional LysR family regulator